MPKDDQPEHEPFPRADLYLLILSTIVAAPLGKSGWDALMTGDYVKGGLALTAGAVALIGGFSFKYWQSHLAAPTRKMFREIVSNRSLVAAGGLIFISYGFVVLPDLVRTIDPPQRNSEILQLKSQLKEAQDQNASLQLQLISALKELEAKGVRPMTNLSSPSLRLSEVGELEKNLAIYRNVQKEGDDLRSEARMNDIEQPGAAQKIASGVIRLRDRAISADIRQTQIFEKYKFADIANVFGGPPSLGQPCNMFNSLLGSLGGPVDVKRDVYEQPAYQSFSDAIIQLAAWLDEKETKIKGMRKEYESASAANGNEEPQTQPMKTNEN
jgi:hypothetical protein